MDRYIGLDVHAQSCTMAVVGPSGKRLKSHVVETNGRALVDAIRSVAGTRYLCFEEGTQSAWLHELLEPHTDEIVVTMPLKRSGPKDDARDAWALAEDYRAGRLKRCIYKAPAAHAGLKNAVRCYGFVTRDGVRVKNRLRAVYRSRGITTDATIYTPEARARWLRKLPPSHRRLAEALGQELDALVPLQDQAEKWLREEAKARPIVKTLATAPGMGAVRTAQVVAIAVTPHRFRTQRQFWAYCGLGIVTRSSADWTRVDGKWVRAQTWQTRGLNKNRQPLLKAVFKGAANTVLQQLHDHPLYEDYQRMLTGGTKPNLAKLTLARRIAAAVLSMWKHEEVYDPEKARRTKKA